jgi:hypothetical protein
MERCVKRELLEELPPVDLGWTLQEHPVGWLTHLFVARRRE